MIYVRMSDANWPSITAFRHADTLFTLLALCEGNPPVTPQRVSNIKLWGLFEDRMIVEYNYRHTIITLSCSDLKNNDRVSIKYFQKRSLEWHAYLIHIKAADTLVPLCIDWLNSCKYGLSQWEKTSHLWRLLSLAEAVIDCYTPSTHVITLLTVRRYCVLC